MIGSPIIWSSEGASAIKPQPSRNRSDFSQGVPLDTVKLGQDWSPQKYVHTYLYFSILTWFKRTGSMP